MSRPRTPAAPFREGRYLVRNAGSGLLLEVYNGAKGSGANVQQGRETGAPGQQWDVTHAGGGLYHLTNVNSGKRLDVANASTENGANVQQWKANNYGAQEWLIEQHLDAPGTVTLISHISGLLLETEGGSGDDGANVRQWEDTDSPFQWWRPEPVAG
ncbi:RICIN domain-containing protein [Streptomyces sp. NPDC091376]|uniref:RICIN domain-containing protein n=1 Tax=Streptomyces sp. NPDC091376 TaxID=3365994 RepID=UPI00381CD602